MATRFTPEQTEARTNALNANIVKEFVMLGNVYRDTLQLSQKCNNILRVDIPSYEIQKSLSTTLICTKAALLAIARCQPKGSVNFNIDDRKLTASLGPDYNETFVADYKYACNLVDTLSKPEVSLIDEFVQMITEQRRAENRQPI